MDSILFYLLIIFILQICNATYQCANDTAIICDEKCMALVDMFHKENSIRYIYIIIIIINNYYF
jgi:hypothetical protein